MTKQTKNGLLLPILFTACVSSPAQAAWVVAPTLELRTAYDDNIRLNLEGNEDAGFVTNATAQAEVSNIKEDSATRGRLTFGYLSYSGSPQAEDRDNQTLTLSHRKQLTRGSYGVQVSAQRDLLLRYANPVLDPFTAGGETGTDEGTQPEIPDSGVVDIDQGATQSELRRLLYRVSPSASLAINRRTYATLSYSFEGTDFEDQDEADLFGAEQYETHRVDLAVQRALNERTTLLLRTQAARFEPDGSPESDSYNATIGVQRSLSSRTFLNAEFGANRLDTDGGDTSNGLEARVNLTYRRENGALVANLQRSLYPSSFGDVLESDVLSLRYQHRFSARWAGSVEGSFSSSESSNSFSSQNRDFVRFSPEINWIMSENWNIAVGYSYTKNDPENTNNSQNANLDAVSHSGYLSLRYQPPREL